MDNKSYLDYNSLVHYTELVKSYINDKSLMKIAKLDNKGNVLTSNMIKKGIDDGVYIDRSDTELFIAHSIASLFNEYYIPVAENIWLKTEWPELDNGSEDNHAYDFSNVIEFPLKKPITEYDYLEIYGMTDDGFKTYVKLINPKVGDTFSLYNVFHNGGNIFFKSRTFYFKTATLIDTKTKYWIPYDYMAGLYFTNGTTNTFKGVTNPPTDETFRISIVRIDGVKSLGSI